jgi:two-component system, sensor histidine kinase
MSSEAPPGLPDERASDSPARQIAKLRKINAVLMQRVERSMEQQANAYSLFQTAIGLEVQVRVRTEELKAALNRLERINDELMQARDASDSANRMKTRFFTAVGHDLLQPLHAARLSLSALSDPLSDFHAHTAVKQIDRSLSSMEDLLRTILDMSGLETGIIKPDLRPIAVEDLLVSLVASLGPLAAAKQLAMTARPTDAAVISDPVMLRRILQNLLANAVHYTQTGAVMMAARRRNGSVRIEVWDTGPGISKAEQKWIFEEFQRGTASKTAQREGFGLGLSIAQRMTETLGARLTVCSKLGQGSMFAVTVPYAGSARLMSPPQTVSPLIGAYGFSGTRVLVINDDPTIASSLGELLERWSCQIRSVSSLTELGDVMTDPLYRPDIVIADYDQAISSNGLAAVQRMRAIFGQSLPAIIMAAVGTDRVADDTRAADCELLHKPVRPSELRALMQHMLG